VIKIRKAAVAYGRSSRAALSISDYKHAHVYSRVHMLGDQRIVVCVATGRLQYLRLLFPQLVSLFSTEGLLGEMPVVDECRLWMNTHDPAVLDACKALVAELPGYFTQEFQPGAPIDPRNPARTMMYFYRNCCEPDTIYIKVDDDVVLLDEPIRFRQYVEYVRAHPEAFMVSANVVNNPATAWLHRQRGIIDDPVSRPPLLPSQDCDPLTMSAGFAERLHRTVCLKGLQHFRFDPPFVVTEWFRVPINFVAWHGERFAAFGGTVPERDEEYLTLVRPQETQSPIHVYGGYAVAHFAYVTQRVAELTSSSCLQAYYDKLGQVL
jgi:hypothetical protein